MNIPSNADVVFSFLGPSHDVVYHFVKSIVLIVESCVLEL